MTNEIPKETKQIPQERWPTAYKITSSYTITSGRTKASAIKYPLTFIMLLRYQFYDPMIHLSFVDLWS
jgi:hypothetical protein